MSLILQWSFMTIWMEELINSRIPDEITPGTIPVLNVIAEESGWAGDLNTFEVKPYMEFQGDPGSASWLPQRKNSTRLALVFPVKLVW